MKEEIQIYRQEIDDLVDNRLKAKIGTYNIYGEEIIFPLTEDTIPTVPLELKAIANDLVVAKIRLVNSEKPLLWDSAVKVLDNYLERVYGWARDVAFQPERTLTRSPASGIIGSTITIGVTNYAPTAKLIIIFDSTEPTTTPTPVITDSTGVVSGVTFNVPANQPDGSYNIKVSDSFGGKLVRFQVTS